MPVRLDSCGNVARRGTAGDYLTPYAPSLSLAMPNPQHAWALQPLMSDSTGIIRKWDDPLQALQWMEQFHRQPAVPGPRFKGGWIGYLSYDCGRLFEELFAKA